MRFLRTYLLLFFSLPVVLSCQAGQVRSEMQETDVFYDDTVYCFNQRSIVTLGSQKGLIDENGTRILAPEWDSIEFLDDEVALLGRSGLWYLCTRDGRFFAESMEKEVLEMSFQERLSAMRDQDYRYWNTVLDQLEALEAACAAAPRRCINEQIIRENAALQALLSQSMGTMSRDQQERLTRLEQDLITLRRK